MLNFIYHYHLISRDLICKINQWNSSKLINGYSGLSIIWLYCKFSPLSKHTFFSYSTDTLSDHVWLYLIFGYSTKGIIWESPFSSLNHYVICLQLEYYCFSLAFVLDAINSLAPSQGHNSMLECNIFHCSNIDPIKKTFMECLIYAWHCAKCYRYRDE